MRWPMLIAVAVTAGLAVLSASATSAIARDWIRPVDGAVLRAFSVATDRFARGQHRGIDLAAPPGARVVAACGGRVRFAGRVPRGGRTVSVRCGSLVATYQHLGSVAVSRGQIVMAGGPIGRAGRPRPVPHVHLGARVAATGEYRDPLALYAGPPRGPLAPIPALRRAPPATPGPAARPLGPAPAPVLRSADVRPRLPVASGVWAARRVGPVAAAPASADAERLPWPVWLGLALVALGLPLGGGLVAAGRRRRRSDTTGRPAFLSGAAR